MKFTIGDWTVTVATNELTQGEKCVRLEARTMDVLCCLYEHRGLVVSKETLIEQVWKLHVVSDHSITVAISDLRRALGCSSKNPKFIETISKRGYRLISSPGDEVEEAKSAEALRGSNLGQQTTTIPRTTAINGTNASRLV